MSTIYSSGLLAATGGLSTRRKCFISYYREDRLAVEKFLRDFGDVFIPKEIGVRDSDDFINSNDTNYVMSRIRATHLGDSTVTLCMIGNCTHSRRYIDWELKSSLRQGALYTPNGLIGILLPHMRNTGHLPPRLKENWQSDESKCFALYRSYPTTKSELRSWIEEAFRRRTTMNSLIRNSQSMMSYSRRCIVHGITH
jgi:hypothetical protein